MINKYLDKQGAQAFANAINSKQNALTFDATPTANSTNPVTSGGIKTALDKKIDVINLEEYCPHLLQELMPTMQSGTPVALSQTALTEYRSLSNIKGKYCKIPSMMGDEMFKLDQFDRNSAAESSDSTYQLVTYFNNIFYGPWTDHLGEEYDRPELNSIMIVHTYYIDNNWQYTENNDYQVVSRNIILQNEIKWDTVPTAGSLNAVRSSDIKTYVDTAISNLPEPMVFKGSLGTGGTITALPVNGTASVGDTYKVITDGTYARKPAKAGDTFICLTKTANTNTWELIPSGDEPSGTVTSVGMTVPTGLSVSGSPVTSSGTLAVSYANGYSIPTTAKQAEWDEKLVYYDLDQDPNIVPIFGGDLPQADLNTACEQLLTVLNDNSGKVIYRIDGYNFIGEHHEGLPWNDGGSTNPSDACAIVLEIAMPMQGLLSTLRMVRGSDGNWQMGNYTFPLQPHVSGSGNAITGVKSDVMNGEFTLEKNATFQEQLTFDTTPTANSTNPVTSGGIKTALDDKIELYVIQERAPHFLQEIYNATSEETGVVLSAQAKAEYEDFVDHEKINSRIFAFSRTDVANNTFRAYRYDGGDEGSRAYDDTLFAYSRVGWPDGDPLEINGLIVCHHFDIDQQTYESLGNDKWWITSNIRYIQEKLTFDTTPTTNSTNPVTSGGVYTALQNKEDKAVVVTLTLNNELSGESDIYTPDKTFEAAVAADRAGQQLVFNITDGNSVMSLDAHVIYISDTPWMIFGSFILEKVLTSFYWGSGEATVRQATMQLQDELTFDATPTANSTNPVTSQGIKTYVDQNIGTLNTTNTTAQSTNASESLNGTVNLHKIAKTGTYSDLIGTPNYYVGNCTTASATAAKATSYSGYTLKAGNIVSMKFTYGNTSTSPTLNINSTGAKPIKYLGSNPATDLIKSNDLVTFIYDGTNYNIINVSTQAIPIATVQGWFE